MMKRTLVIGVLAVGVAASLLVLKDYRVVRSQMSDVIPQGKDSANEALEARRIEYETRMIEFEAHRNQILEEVLKAVPEGKKADEMTYHEVLVLRKRSSELRGEVMSQGKPWPSIENDIDALEIEALRKQPLEELLSLLDRWEPYESGGVRQAGFYGLDPPEINRWYATEQQVVLSSRVFRKCLQEIKSLPPQESASFINRHLESALTAYIDACVAERSISILGEDKDGNPSFSGIRYKIYALMLIAGTCELTDCHAMVGKVAHVAWEQKKWREETDRIFYEFGREEADLADSLAPQPYLRSPYNSPLLVSLMNPHALSAGLLGTHPRKDSAEFKEIAGRYKEHKIADYTVPSIALPGMGNINIRYFESATDEDVGTLLGVSNR